MISYIHTTLLFTPCQHSRYSTFLGLSVQSSSFDGRTLNFDQENLRPQFASEPPPSHVQRYSRSTVRHYHSISSDFPGLNDAYNGGRDSEANDLASLIFYWSNRLCPKFDISCFSCYWIVARTIQKAYLYACWYHFRWFWRKDFLPSPPQARNQLPLSDFRYSLSF